ncbi:MAG: hypothetical protein TR69_WS6001001067 [candidate division WS6 bacterium OLB20]|uniref:Uncharacterized protein n=1 Tax=candidate division WS6 bacterium OLB20 TaxID=1617426 RepID=A0A136LZH0_9BACT|nr:MAG: hypothetical protein TR69_WS6001001067 [candidate division WS6 bacterium OLB20]
MLSPEATIQNADLTAENLPDIYSSEAGSVSLIAREFEGSTLYSLKPELRSTADLDDCVLLLRQATDRIRSEIETIGGTRDYTDPGSLAAFAYLFLDLDLHLGEQTRATQALTRLATETENDGKEKEDVPVLRWIYYKGSGQRVARLMQTILTGDTKSDRTVPARGNDADSEFEHEVRKMNEAVADLQIRMESAA